VTLWNSFLFCCTFVWSSSFVIFWQHPVSVTFSFKCQCFYFRNLCHYPCFKFKVSRAGVGNYCRLRLFVCLSVCLSVCSITQKTNDPKVFKLVIGNDLGYPRNDVVLGWKVNGQGHRVNKCIFQTNDYYAYVNGLTTAKQRGFELYDSISLLFINSVAPRAPLVKSPRADQISAVHYRCLHGLTPSYLAGSLHLTSDIVGPTCYTGNIINWSPNARWSGLPSGCDSCMEQPSTFHQKCTIADVVPPQLEDCTVLIVL